MGEILTYFGELTRSMERLAADPRTLFVGQAVRYGGQAMAASFENVPADRRIEFPVAEDLQMGYCLGLSLMGYIPVCVYPRWDFLLLAANQLVNHLDKLPLMSEYRPKVIIRVAVGSTMPLNAGPQHTQNHSEAFRLMLHTIRVINLREEADIVPAYTRALTQEGSQVLVESMDEYQL